MAKESRVKTYSRKTKKGLTRVKSHLKRNKKKIIAGAATLGALGIGYAALRRKKMLRMKNPKIVKPTVAGLIPERTRSARAKSNYTDNKGKKRKKGQILPGVPKGESSIILEPTTTVERVAFNPYTLDIFDPEFKKGKINPSERNMDLIAEAKALRELERRKKEKLGPKVDFKPKNKKDNK
jgi:hypothetical protein